MYKWKLKNDIRRAERRLRESSTCAGERVEYNKKVGRHIIG
jgi:hypothetical protein